MVIDWSKAPEGTTGAVVANFDGGSVRKGDIRFIPSGGRLRGGYCEDEDAWTYHEAPALPKWTGEGLPPVGERIEYRSKDGCDPKEWTAVYVLAHAKHGHDDAMLLAEESSGDCKHGKMYGRIWMPGTCRVARTEEQIAADREIEALAKDIMAEQHISGRLLAERLHALGYRKTEGGAA